MDATLYEVVLHSIDSNGDETEETYTTARDREDAERAALLLRRSSVPFIIEIREFDPA